MHASKTIAIVFCICLGYACQSNSSQSPPAKKEIISPPLSKIFLWPYYLPDHFIDYYRTQQIIKIDVPELYPNGFLFKNKAGDSLYYVKPKYSTKYSTLLDTTLENTRYGVIYMFDIEDISEGSPTSHVQPPKNYKMQIGETYTFVFISQYDSSTTFLEHSFVYDGAYNLGFKIIHTDLLNTKKGCSEAISISKSMLFQNAMIYSLIGLRICNYAGPFRGSYYTICSDLNRCISEVRNRFENLFDIEYGRAKRLAKARDSIWASSSHNKALDFKQELEKSEQKIENLLETVYRQECKDCLIKFFEKSPIIPEFRYWR